MATATATNGGIESNDKNGIEAFTDRDVRALTEYIIPLEEIGRVKDADGLFLVVGESGKEYTVDVWNRACDCPDMEYNNPDGGCKHIRRCEFESGIRPIPTAIDRSAIKVSTQIFGEFVNGEPVFG
jgi:hypothetical protein